MKISAAGIALIKRFEGFSATPYRCPAGYRTIGYGHLARAHTPQQVSEAEAEELLRGDVRLAEAAVARLITRPLRQHQFDALVSFTFNLGAGALQRSRLRRVINRGADSEAPREFMRWIYAQNRPLPGLIARRIEEARIYVENQYIDINVDAGNFHKNVTKLKA